MTIERVLPRKHYTYRCQYCGHECVSKKMPQSNLPVTRTGDYGSNATPTPSIYTQDDAMISSRTISFTAASGSDPAKISDAQGKIADSHMKEGMTINVETESGTNDGNYTIADRGVSIDEVRLSSSDSLTTENAATAGLVSIYRRTYQPNVTTGCSFCGSLNSKKRR